MANVTLNVTDAKGQATGTVEAPAELFGISNEEIMAHVPLVHQVVVAQLAAARQGTHAVKNRGAVSGGGKKPWKQKGTGRARQGSTRAPQWTHGGIVFAPKPRDYSYVLNKKVKRLALKSVLSAKVAEGQMVVIDSIKMDAIKTADFRKFLTAVGVDGKAMVVTPAVDQTIVKSARNIPGVVTTPASILSVYDILNAKYLVVDKDALAKIEEVYA